MYKVYRIPRWVYVCLPLAFVLAVWLVHQREKDLRAAGWSQEQIEAINDARRRKASRAVACAVVGISLGGGLALHFHRRRTGYYYRRDHPGATSDVSIRVHYPELRIEGEFVKAYVMAADGEILCETRRPVADLSSVPRGRYIVRVVSRKGEKSVSVRIG